MAAAHGLQVLYLGFLANSQAYEMGVPDVPLASLYSPDAWAKYESVKFAFRTPVQSLGFDQGRRLRSRCAV